MFDWVSLLRLEVCKKNSLGKSIVLMQPKLYCYFMIPRYFLEFTSYILVDYYSISEGTCLCLDDIYLNHSKDTVLLVMI